MVADDDQDDEEDAGDGDCNEKDDEGRHFEENLHQIEANEEKRPSKFEEDIVLTDRDCGKGINWVKSERTKTNLLCSRSRLFKTSFVVANTLK